MEMQLKSTLNRTDETRHLVTTKTRPNNKSLGDIALTLLEKGMSAEEFLKQKITSCVSSGEQDPFFVADLGELVHNHRRFLQELPRVKPHYAVKCNNSREVLRALAALGTGFDCASKGEIDLVLSIGVPVHAIVYANPCKPLSHISHAIGLGVLRMTFDCECELVKIAVSHPEAEMILRISVDDSGSVCRLNKKFGVPLKDCEHLLVKAKNLNIQIIGVSFHVGSAAWYPQAFNQSIKDARKVFDIGNKLGHKMKFLDIGGGFPGKRTFQPSFEEFASVINAALDYYFPVEQGIVIIAEPGRYYVTSAYTLALSIIARKEVNVKEENETKRISYYLNNGIFLSFSEDSMFKTQLEPTSFLNLEKKLSGPRYCSTLWGLTSDEEDIIMDETYLPDMDVSDWIIFPNKGAYSISLYSSYCGFPNLPIHYVISEELWCFLRKSGIFP